jgi:Tfp pilus assembly pilus retraction ATPase PilT
MQTLDQCLVKLYLDGLVTAEEAMSKAGNPEEFARRAGISTQPGKA